MWLWLTTSSPTVEPEVSLASRKSLCLGCPAAWAAKKGRHHEHTGEHLTEEGERHVVPHSRDHPAPCLQYLGCAGRCCSAAADEEGAPHLGIETAKIDGTPDGAARAVCTRSPRAG